MNPRTVDEFVSLSHQLIDQRQDLEALRVAELGLQLHPKNPALLGNRSAALNYLGLYSEALASCVEQIELIPNEARAWVNLGNFARDLGQLQDSELAFRRALELDPELASAHYNLGITLLTAGRYQEGFEEYRWRFKSAVFKAFARHYKQRHWNGGDLRGKRLLVWSEQGAGDIIQYMRYVPLIQGDVVFEVPKSLLRLAKATVNCPVVVREDDPPFDIHVPLVTLPALMGGIIPPVPYVQLPEASHRKLTGSKPKVGLAWAGNPEHRNDHNRSMPFEQLKPLLSFDYEFYSLQMGPQAASTLQHPQIQDATQGIGDYLDTASVLRELDLLITVDTSVAHLAGTLGVPTWMMIPFVPDYRWLRDREDSVWYPSLRVLRQPAPKDYGSVVARVAAELPLFVESLPRLKKAS